jgi:thioredoxin reductase
VPTDSTYDCIIVGGGPAGLTCGVFLGRYRRRTLLIHNSRPRNYASRAIHGFLGQHGIAPLELLKRGCDEARAAGVEICECTAEKIERIGDIFEVTTTTGTFRARRIALAYGVRDLLPDGIPQFEKYYGSSVFHCPDCDGYEVSGKRIGVIGWGKSAVGMTFKLMQWSDDITIFTHGNPRDFSKEETSKLLAEQIAVKDERIIELTGDGEMLRSMVLSTGERVEVDAVFFTIGVERSCDLAEQLGCAPAEGTAANLQVNDYKETTVQGVYAIGDLAPGSQLAITSAADGAIAAIAINKSLLPPSRQV